MKIESSLRTLVAKNDFPTSVEKTYQTLTNLSNIL